MIRTTVGNARDGGRGHDSVLPSDVYEGASNVLLMGSPMDSLTLDTGFSLLVDDTPETTRVLWVTLLNTPREVVDLWDSFCPARPDQLHIVLVGEGLSTSEGVPDPDVYVHFVSDPSDLTTLGVRVLNALSVMESGDENADLYLRFDSLTPLSQYVRRQGLVQFLHVLTTRLSDGGVHSHFHLDPLAHDSQTVHTLGSIFDVQVRVEDDGVSLTHR